MGQEVSHFSTPSKTGSGSPHAITHPVGTLGSFLRRKAAGRWSWAPKRRVRENVHLVLYTYSWHRIKHKDNFALYKHKIQKQLKWIWSVNILKISTRCNLCCWHVVHIFIAFILLAMYYSLELIVKMRHLCRNSWRNFPRRNSFQNVRYTIHFIATEPSG